MHHYNETSVFAENNIKSDSVSLSEFIMIVNRGSLCTWPRGFYSFCSKKLLPVGGFWPFLGGPSGIFSEGRWSALWRQSGYLPHHIHTFVPSIWGCARCLSAVASSYQWSCIQKHSPAVQWVSVTVEVFLGCRVWYIYWHLFSELRKLPKVYSLPGQDEKEVSKLRHNIFK